MNEIMRVAFWIVLGTALIAFIIVLGTIGLLPRFKCEEECVKQGFGYSYFDVVDGETYCLCDTTIINIGVLSK